MKRGGKGEEWRIVGKSGYVEARWMVGKENGRGWEVKGGKEVEVVEGVGG